MNDPNAAASTASELRPEPKVQALGAVLEQLSVRFDENGVLGVLLMEAPILADIERKHGADARRQAFDRLAEIAVEVAGERLDVDDLLVEGESGRNELVVLMFRQNRDARFFRQELPGFYQAMQQSVNQRGQQLFYPFSRHALRLVRGTAMIGRNPKYAPVTQLRKALDEARGDADLNRRMAARTRRHSFQEMILDRRVTSVYEPIVDVNSRTVFGYEALARGPAGEFHSPLVLFGTAEKEDLVFELDCLCRASGLAGAVGLPEDTKLFLNILPTTIHDPNFRAERLIRTLEKCELRPSDVVFEISEQESISNFSAFLEIRDYYRDLGFQFALDDTGAGYAGLEALLEISPEFVKVDRSFVSGVDEDAARQGMLSALLSVAETNGARVIGEGLDTLEELAMLAELGIHFGQGWLFGKPTPLRAED